MWKDGGATGRAPGLRLVAAFLSRAIIIAVAVAAKGGLTGVNGSLRGSTEASQTESFSSVTAQSASPHGCDLAPSDERKFLVEMQSFYL